MRADMRVRFWVALGCLAAVLGVLAWYFLVRSDPLATQVEQLLAAMPTRGSQAIVDDLWALGPRVIPHLARNAARRESLLAKAYEAGRGWLPKGARGLFPKLRDSKRIRLAAMEAIAGLGPLAAYGAAPEVIAGLSDPSQAVHAQYGLEWLVPEHPEASNAFARLVRDTNQPLPMRDLSVSEYIWPRTSGLLPSLMGRLTQPNQAHLAAIALHHCGSNAAPAVPLLLETLDRCPADHGRATAAKALGAIGVVTPEVISVLARGWNDSNAWVRINAANAITALASNFATVPAELISGLRDPHNQALAAKLEAFQAIGPAARKALGIIQELAGTNAFHAFVMEGDDQQVMGARVRDITMSARMAICSIAPDQCASLLPKLVTHIGESWSLVQFLRERRRFSNDVINAVGPLLKATNDFRRASIAAYIILGQNSNHTEAIAVLQRNKTQGPEGERRLAGERLFDSTGDTNGVWEFIEQGLAPESKFGQWSIQWAGKMGPAAIPTLRRALWHKDKFVRTRAGMILRKMAPEQLKVSD